MPALRKDQFWKGNPNQMSFPGLEEHGHPGARYLSQGYRFHTEHYNFDDDMPAAGISAMQGDRVAAELHWVAEPHKGEIGWVNTHPDLQHRGLATALYGMGRTMARVKPQHSSNRTPEGDAFAVASSKKFGGRVPKNGGDW